MESLPTEDARSFCGTPDGFTRLWTPHRMAYINGEKKPTDASSNQCPFCQAPKFSDAEGLIVYRGANVFVVMNLFPYNSGHLLVMPYEHLSLYTDLSTEVRAEFGEVTASAMRVLQGVTKCQGVNLGMNQGEVAGAGIAAHLHQHLVPRWQGDANFFPIIAQTKALPQLLETQREQLSAAWEEYA
ncbi:HIT family hydrolase [Boudabousia tangfeifanii]|uniref:HIT family hydrolase n=1 Tax=Boudabousia tangfeifanii TaxID=1912795 RepID=A0A1D9MKG1_9ACTO|nr:HIT domain-containing protein [Boudabousia tangfeifanii]AOZ72663.1 HIT family hydrolase [Boudabousia tangfeifanii]